MSHSEIGSTSVNERVSRNEKAIEGLENRVDKIENRDVSIQEMAVSLAEQTQMNRVQNEQIIKIMEDQKEQSKEVNITLKNINNNLTELNTTQQQMQNELKNQGERLSDVEQTIEEEKKEKKASRKEWFKQIRGFVFGILSAVTIAALLVWLGLK